MNIVIGSDHGGYELKCVLAEYLKSLNHDVRDVGTNSKDACDYPDFAFRVAEYVAANEGSIGIMVDGAGIGSAMCANRVPGVLAATCNELFVTKNAREHNSANVMCLGSQVVGPGLAKKLVDVFIGSKFEGGRHANRVNKILGYASSGVQATESLIKTIASRVMALVSGSGASCAQAVSGAAQHPDLITEEYIRLKCASGETLALKRGTLVTALAMDAARAKGVTVRFE